MKLKRKFRMKNFKHTNKFEYTSDGYKVDGQVVDEKDFKDLLFFRAGFKKSGEYYGS